MTVTTHEIKCAKCDVPVKGPADAKADSIVSCPVCGVSDTKENVEREAADYVTSKMSDAIGDTLRDISSNHKWITHTERARDEKIYRFVVDYSPQL